MIRVFLLRHREIFPGAVVLNKSSTLVYPDYLIRVVTVGQHAPSQTNVTQVTPWKLLSNPSARAISWRSIRRNQMDCHVRN